MNFTPLFDAQLAIRLHVMAVIPAAMLGPIIFAMPKGTRLHRLLGALWMLLMLTASVSSLFIHQLRLIGPFSPLHSLAVFVIVGCVRAIWAVRKGRVQTHQNILKSVYIGGIIVAGAFSFAPGRLMSEMMLEGTGHPVAAFLMLLVLALMTASVCYWRMKRSRTASQ